MSEVAATNLVGYTTNTLQARLVPASPLHNMHTAALQDNDGGNQGGASIDVRQQNSPATFNANAGAGGAGGLGVQDEWWLVLTMMGMCGAGFLFPFNSFIVAVDYLVERQVHCCPALSCRTHARTHIYTRTRTRIHQLTTFGWV